MALQKVSDKDVLLPTLSKLLRFLAILGEDANFKISLSTMQILADLAQKVGPDIRPYLGYVSMNMLLDQACIAFDKHARQLYSMVLTTVDAARMY